MSYNKVINHLTNKTMNELKSSCIEFVKNPNVNGTIWKDATSYSQNNKERTPTAFSLQVENGFSIYITCNHFDYKDTFIFHCEKLGMRCVELKSKTAKDAAIESIKVVQSELNRLQSLLT